MATISPNLAEIGDEIVKSDKAKRIVIKLKTCNLDSGDYRASACEFLDAVFPDWEHDNRILFLTIQVHVTRTFLVVEINNHAYDFFTAHDCKTLLPVYVLLQKGRRGWALVRWPQQDEDLAIRLADIHQRHGWHARTPILENYIHLVVCADPRALHPRPSIDSSTFTSI
ncbi:uncharacterized protein BO97DRAFT_443573 [Aspergillus homomorphus CBS 101889]|uniref:Uncharacterized protein n=1 Tax=Aspergillus homomorphus (strain CBS 101889) TaxID=1450537 RepID=A0A395HWR1_ASPHC|nr:hypothetical protein BO97DRAFT_443573 [Aspergillus homomorphus CBS 101889]RAL11865.1 hypothetical protein BO97DRAFT_443573 [Aspergillus homomorphus CBS 101889]